MIILYTQKFPPAGIAPPHFIVTFSRSQTKVLSSIDLHPSPYTE